MNDCFLLHCAESHSKPICHIYVGKQFNRRRGEKILLRKLISGVLQSHNATLSRGYRLLTILCCYGSGAITVRVFA